MATTARELQYRNRRMVDGSSAYDLDWEVREWELTHAGEAARPQKRVYEQPKEKAEVRTREKAAVRPRQQVSVLTLASFGLILAMAVWMLTGYVQLTMLSAETVELKNELSTLETEHVTLTAQYERMFDLTSVKEAALAAGMSKPSSSQVYYIDLSEGDNAVVFQKENPSVMERAAMCAKDALRAMVEYFT